MITYPGGIGGSGRPVEDIHKYGRGGFSWHNNSGHDSPELRFVWQEVAFIPGEDELYLQ